MLPDSGSLCHTYQGMRLAGLTRYDATGDELASARYDRYDLSGKVREMTLPGYVKVFLEYDPLQRPTAILTVDWQQTEIAYDPVGNLTSYESEEKNAFKYDPLDQLASENGAFRHTWRHDSLYNLTGRNDIKIDFNALNQPRETHLKYDLNGNLVQKGDLTLIYDPLDRLIEVKQGNEQTRYTYDAFNRRLTANDKNFLYHNEDEIGLVQNDVLKEFRWLGVGRGAEIGASLAFELEGEVYAPIHDACGNVSALYNDEGDLAAAFQTSAFGCVKTECSFAIPWLFSSKRLDPETGFYFFGRRFYDPDSHRFITADPLKFDGGSNLYAYCQNRPLSLNDLYGLSPINGLEPGSFWNMFANAFSSFFQTLGSSFEQFGQQVPIPLVRDLFTGTGHLLAGKSPESYVPSWSRDHTRSGSLPGTDDKPGHLHYYTNGISNTYDEFMNSVDKYQKKMGGVTVHYTYNGSRGILLDLLESTAQKLGIQTRPDMALKENMTKLINENGGPGSDFKIHLTAHSQGGLTVGNLAHNLAPEYCKILHVSTIGSARLIPNGVFGSVVNYISAGDCVPWTDPVGYIKGLSNSGVNMVVLKCQGIPLFDHAMGGKTYQNVLDDISLRFYKEY